jgi:hypothetical protein
MDKAKLKITTNGQYKNLNLKEKLIIDIDGREVKTEDYVLQGKFVLLTKAGQFAEGKEIPSKFTKPDGGKADSSFLCKAEYEGEEVSFFLTRREHEAYKVLGGLGDTVKVLGTRNDKWLNLSFELVE